MADVEAKKARSLCKSKFTRLVKATSNNLGTLTKTLLESRLTELRSLWSELQTRHDEYVICITNGEELDDESEHNTWIATCQTTYENLEAMIDKALLGTNNANDAGDNDIQLKQHTDNKLALETKIEACDGKFKQTVADINELLTRKTEMEHVASAVASALTRLESIKSETEHNRNELVITTINANQEVPPTIKTAIIETEREYNEISTLAKIFCSKHDNVSKNTSSPKSTPKENTCVRIGEVQFEKFNGNRRIYPTFKTEFLKHIKTKYPSSEEAFILKSFLEPGIKQDILSAGDDATEIWRRLDSKYGDEGKLVDDIMKDIKLLQKCNDNQPKGIITMITTVERAYRDLKYMSRESEISNATIVSLIEQKLPKSIEDDWLKVVTGEHRSVVARDKFPQLLKVLLSFKERLEYKFSELRIPDNIEEEEG